jgi:tRNA(Ile)-lysidine synthase TilS/MesJ
MCRKALYEFKLLEGVERLGIALSGGKDSLALLFLLKEISGRGFPPFTLHAFHVTGAFSCGASMEVSYLEEVCQELSIPLTVKCAEQSLEKLECYSCSRTRRKLIFDAAKEVGITTIAFGHHRDDMIETLLMNLLHKAEFAGMLPKIPLYDFGVTVIRPLIFIGEAEIRTLAEQSGFARIVCRCPVGTNSLRRKTKDLIETLEEVFPNARNNLAQAAHTHGSKKALNMGASCETRFEDPFR